MSNGSQYFAHPVSALHAIGADLYVGGHFGNAGTATAAGIARFNLTTGWSAVSGSISGTRSSGAFATGPEVRAFLQDGSYLYVAGDFTATGGGPAESIARYDLMSGAWTPLGSGLAYEHNNITAQALARGPAGLYIGGKFTWLAASPPRA